MTFPCSRLPALTLIAALCLVHPLWAQTSDTAPLPSPTLSPAGASNEPAAQSADSLPTVQLKGAVVTSAEVAPAPAEPPPPPAPLTCRQISDRANAADLKAANAQSAKAPAVQIATQLDESIQWWTQALSTCEGRARERAERNLADSQRGRASLQDHLGADPECLAGQKDATQLQELAQQAVRERRWLDASVMYRKAENLWEDASEVCKGDLQTLASQRREQAAQDGHNAEFCAPLFDRAREYAQLIRRQPGTPALEKQTQSMAAETLWREAEQQCKGTAQTLARTNAQNLARERGTPWIATALPAGVQLATTKPLPQTPTPAVTANAAPKPSSKVATAGTVKAVSEPINPARTTPVKPDSTEAATASTSSLVVPGTLQATAVASGAKTAAAATDTTAVGSAMKFLSGLLPNTANATTLGAEPAPASLAQPPQPRPLDEEIAGVRFQGTFVNTGGLLTGNGKVQWPSGDSYTGNVDNHQPHGQGTYQWANGQTYQGEWKVGQPHGKGTMKFANGNFYEGSMAQGLPQGRGKMIFAWGDSYEGDFAAGLPDSSGHYRWKNGDQYTGDWKAGKKHGNGTLEWATGDKWIGRYEEDQQVTGTLTRKSP